MHYPFSTVEPKWQKSWDDEQVYRTSDDTSKPKYYVLDMFPYPSGSGLHIGHPEGYTATDIVSRFKRMCGFNVLHPMGFDAFGLPTERQAMIENIHPRLITERNVATFTRQLKSFGFDYDWTRQVNTTNPEYVRWTQWMFLRIYNSWYDETANKARHIDELSIPSNITDRIEIERYKDERRLAFIANIPVNWCEALGTVLANEEVDEWVEKGYTVERRPMRQWMLRITAYAQRLLEDLETLDWPSSTVDMQRNWIGRSEGAVVRFALEGHDTSVEVFTTRPDTIFGATYMVLAPEHALVNEITTQDQRAGVEAYRNAASLKSDLERTELEKDKTGVNTGAFAINPASGERIPVWIADYVLAHYGTGAVMAVPSHDHRDHVFAAKYKLPFKTVVEDPSQKTSTTPITSKTSKSDRSDDEAFVDDGVGINSSNNSVSLNGLPTPQAKRVIIDWLDAQGIGSGKVQYKLRDWLFSRQRYWGEPIPIMFFADGTKRSLDDDELPLLLPDVDDFNPAGTGESALATVKEWVDFTDAKTGRHASMETNTMPQWAGSCWYFLRYIDHNNSAEFASKSAQQYWMGNAGIDLYIGGAEHAVLHLLYARFWHKVLFDLGYVTTHEPVKRLFHQGLILAEDGRKMSKSTGNSVSPDEMIAQYGADAIRLYEMFLGPLEASKPWNSRGIEGVSRFLDRVWRLVVNEDGNIPIADVDIPAELDSVLHTTIAKTRADVDALSFNTSIAQFMIFVNAMTASEVRPKKAIEQFLCCLAPFAPHIADELWSRLGNTTSIHLTSFPVADLSKTVKDEVQVVLQVNAKIRGKVMLPANVDEATMEKTAMEDEGVQRHLKGKTIRKVIVVRGKLVNFIAS